MKGSELLVQNILNFQSLSLIIGRLITDGNFEVLSVLYHPNSLDDRLLSAIVSHSPPHLQLMITDITCPNSTDWNKHYGDNHIIQLIFVDREFMLNISKTSEEKLLTNKVFVFVSIDEFEYDMKLKRVGFKYHFYFANSLILFHSLRLDKTEIYLFPPAIHQTEYVHPNKTIDFNPNSKYLNQTPDYRQQGPPKSLENVYAMTFGHIYSHEYLYLYNYQKADRNPITKENDENFKLENFRSFLSKLFLNKLNIKYLYLIDVTKTGLNGTFNDITFYRRHVNRSREIYDELIFNLEPVHINKRWNSYVHRYGFGVQEIMSAWDQKGLLARSKLFYPHSNVDVVVLIVHPKSEKIDQKLSEGFQLKNLSIWFIWIAVGGLILFVLRLIAKVRRNSPSIAFLDLVSVFFGGGNLTWNHRVEKFFFLIMMIGAFFFNSIFSGILFDLYKEVDLDRIDTFAKLSKANLPIYLGNYVVRNENSISSLIREKVRPDAKIENIGAYMKNQSYWNNKPYAYVSTKDDVKSLLERYIGSVKMNIIHEPLVTYYKSFVLVANHTVPEALDSDLNKLIQSIVENGLLKFYERIAEHLSRIRNLGNEIPDHDEERPVTFKRLQLYFNCYIGGMAIATVIFIGELLWHKYSDRVSKIWHTMVYSVRASIRARKVAMQASIYQLREMVRALWANINHQWRLFRSRKVRSTRVIQVQPARPVV